MMIHSTITPAAESSVRAERPILISHTKFVFEGWGPRLREYLKKEGGVLVFKDTRTNGEIETYRTTEDLASIDLTRPDGTVRKAWTPHSGFLSFPLYIGKKWETRYTLSRKGRRKISRERNCRVVGYENTTVKAGTFPSFIIGCENQREGATRPAYERYAYAPGVGQVILYTSAEFDITFQLVKIVPPPQQITSKQ